MRLPGRSSLARCPALIAGLFVLALLAPGSLHAWKPDTQRAIALDAAALAPPDLARLIQKHRKEYLRGTVEPLADTSGVRHMKNPDGSGELDQAVTGEMTAAIDLIRRHRPFAEVVARLGRISHFIADANLPLNTANSDTYEARYFRDFLDYADSARPRFAVVFYGLGPEWKSPRDLQAWTRATFARGRKLYPAIGEEYRRIGVVDGSRLFDDRSTAFAVAALSYSHAVSDVARALRYVWLAAGGVDPRARLAARRDALLVVDAGAARSAGPAGPNDGR
ncbi:MAG: hypothetical protein QG573_2440 [Acidobacteriota bacterium]|nr:hypothetical protein [Acidobacteriota bacterium]